MQTRTAPNKVAQNSSKPSTVGKSSKPKTSAPSDENKLRNGSLPETGKAHPASAASDGSSGTRRVRLVLTQPNAKEVFVAGSFNDWQPRATPLSRSVDGPWAAELRLKPGEYEYRFIVDGEWVEDPAAEQQVSNSFGSHNSVLRVNR